MLLLLLAEESGPNAVDEIAAVGGGDIFGAGRSAGATDKLEIASLGGEVGLPERRGEPSFDGFVVV